MELASFGRRYMALSLDVLFLEILGTLITIPLVMQAGQDPVLILFRLMQGNASPEQAMFFLVHLGTLTLLWTGYFTWFVGSCGQTPGKKILKLRVITRKGDPAGMIPAFLRLVTGMLIFILTLGVGYMWIVFDSDHQAIHDKISDTLVVRLTEH